MNLSKKVWSAVVGLGLILASLSPIPASANTAPNPYTPVGQSWINVPEASKVYFESFSTDQSTRYYDDNSIHYVAAGITCTFNDVTATGPFLTGRDLGENECVDASTNPIDPIDNATRAGAIPFGFNINFFGSTYSSAWPNTNGGIFFNAPDTNYDRTMPNLASSAESSVMFPFGADLYYAPNDSNFWTAQTQIDSQPAVVFSWERFHNCCNDDVGENMSFQLVLIDVGGGDFNAYFNYDAVINFDQGYQMPQLFVDLETGVSLNSNLLVTDDVSLAPAECTEFNYRTYGSLTDSQQISSTTYLKQNSLGDKTISIWSDSACTQPINIATIQNIANDGHAYIEFRSAQTSMYGVAVGWATFDLATKKIDWTELLRNKASSDFVDSGSDPLIQKSLNTTVPGRFVIGQRGGKTVTDSSSLGLEAVAEKVTKAAKKSIHFATSSKVLTKQHKAAIKKIVKTSGKEATFTITGVAGRLPGVTTDQVKKLAKLRAKVVKNYLIKLGVNKANIKIKIKITNQGIVPKSKILAKYLAS